MIYQSLDHPAGWRASVDVGVLDGGHAERPHGQWNDPALQHTHSTDRSRLLGVGSYRWEDVTKPVPRARGIAGVAQALAKVTARSSQPTVQTIQRFMSDRTMA